MIRLHKVGTIAPKASKDISKSRIGLGFEKLDRDVFDPEKAYPFVAQSGVKWARLQSGWQRTEKEKGVYDFAWLDTVVDNLIAIGVEPWLCLCYGNALYTEMAKEHFGAVGCVPIHSEEEKQAWRNYVHATVTHFKGRIHRYEVWNEPDGLWCWKHGPSGRELGEFTIDTAKVCKAADPDCKVIGFCTCRTNRFHYIDELCETGVCDYIDSISYHSYKIHDREFEDCYRYYENIAQKHNPKLTIIQGESGTQSRCSEAGAYKKMNWDEQKQAKYLLRELLIDLATDVLFTSYFSTMDMAEALHGMANEAHTIHDYGYFGVLAAEFDENGVASGEYHEKPSYYALQNLAALFEGDVKNDAFPFIFIPEESRFINAYDRFDADTIALPFRLVDGRKALAYWQNTNLLEGTLDSVTSIEILCKGEAQLIDLMSGKVYAFTEEMITRNGNALQLKHIPLRDYPLLLVWNK